MKSPETELIYWCFYLFITYICSLLWSQSMYIGIFDYYLEFLDLFGTKEVSIR